MKSSMRIALMLAALGQAVTCFAMERAETFAISGSTGLPGVVMKGLPNNPITDQNGHYSVRVPSGWKGTVTPLKEGYVFDPPARTYDAVRADYTDENYTALVMTFTISGSVGLPDVIMQGLPDEPMTASDGTYQATLQYGWSGTVTPVKEGYTFKPASRPYSQVRANQTNQNYAPRVITVTISGSIGIPGVEMQGLPDNPMSRSDGTYEATVPYGWSGKVTPIKGGYTFDPPSKSYTDVTTNIKDGWPEMPMYRERLAYGRTVGPRYGRTTGRTDRGRVLVIPTMEVKPEEFEATKEDMHVMLYILEKELQKPRLIQGVFFDFGDFFAREGYALQAVYVQDYGAFFFTEVDFPLVFPSKSQEPPVETTKEQVDPIWQRAQQEMFSSQDPAAGGPFPGRQEGGPETLEVLKNDLIRLLKHASNIRNLKSDEWVILTVIGAGGRPIEGGMMVTPGATMGTRSKPAGGGMYGTGGYGGGAAGFGLGGYGGAGGVAGYGAMGGAGFGFGRMAVVPGMGTASSATLTMRVKKADVDAFAKGDIDFEQFQQKVKILTY